MKFKLMATSSVSPELKEDVMRVAEAAFTQIPRDELLQRFQTYDYLGLALDDGRVVAFSFLSEHSVDQCRFIGFRLSATHPDYQGSGLLSRITRRLFWTRLAAFYGSRLRRGLASEQLFLFCRACSPLAYKSIHLGQTVYPDLIGHSGLEIPGAMQVHFQTLAGLLQLEGLDTRSGLIRDGAANAGITHSKKDISLEEKWLTPWSSVVPSGSELLVLAPFRLSHISKYVTDFWRKERRS